MIIVPAVEVKVYDEAGEITYSDGVSTFVPNSVDSPRPTNNTVDCPSEPPTASYCSS